LKEKGEVAKGEAPEGKKANGKMAIQGAAEFSHILSAFWRDLIVTLSLSDENFGKLVSGKAKAQSWVMASMHIQTMCV
jgi:hypothetical protein